MSIAQRLYENGYITYMRTDSTTLSESAINAARNQARQLYGEEYVHPTPRQYTRKVKNAQEAHEAIRPAGDVFQTPGQLHSQLDTDEFRLYELIWQRTVASQMADARGTTLSLRISGAARSGEQVVFSASGRTITFAGFLKAYVESLDEQAGGEADDAESRLPNLTEGQRVDAKDLTADGHNTSPPARYTEASLIKALEELGIGRPSTYATIPQTMQDRGYVVKRGTALVPTWTAFAVVQLLEQHFANLVDYAFTARMEDELDEIARKETERVPWLREFWFGQPSGGNGDGLPDVSEGSAGLKALIDQGMEVIDPAQINMVLTLPVEGADDIVVRPGRYGPYLKQGDRTASIPDDLAPDELTTDKALELLDAPSGDKYLGTDPDSGLDVIAKAGRFGPYVQLGEGEKPKRSSLPKGWSAPDMDLEKALRLLRLPREVGLHPEDGKPILAGIGKFGPFVLHEKTYANLPTVDEVFEVGINRAVDLIAAKRAGGKRGEATALKELGAHPADGQPIRVLSGRYGPYVKHGSTNANVPRGADPLSVTLEQAVALIAERAAKGGGGKKKPARAKAEGAAASKTKKAAKTKKKAKATT